MNWSFSSLLSEKREGVGPISSRVGESRGRDWRWRRRGWIAPPRSQGHKHTKSSHLWLPFKFNPCWRQHLPLEMCCLACSEELLHSEASQSVETVQNTCVLSCCVTCIYLQYVLVRFESKDFETCWKAVLLTFQTFYHSGTVIRTNHYVNFLSFLDCVIKNQAP